MLLFNKSESIIMVSVLSCIATDYMECMQLSDMWETLSNSVCKVKGISRDEDPWWLRSSILELDYVNRKREVSSAEPD